MANDFGWAMKALKAGSAVYRESWRNTVLDPGGKGDPTLWVELLGATDAVPQWLCLRFMPGGGFMPYEPTRLDLFGEDWEVVPEHCRGALKKQTEQSKTPKDLAVEAMEQCFSTLTDRIVGSATLLFPGFKGIARIEERSGTIWLSMGKGMYDPAPRFFVAVSFHAEEFAGLDCSKAVDLIETRVLEIVMAEFGGALQIRDGIDAELEQTP